MKAETIAKALGGRKTGAAWMARCPAHADREPSLSICDADDGKVLLHCHAGCGQERVISVLRSRGLWVQTGHHSFVRRVARPAANHRLDHDEAKRREAALAIWGQSISAAGTLAEPYLASRGLRQSLPERIRCHPGLKHPAGGVWPAMVALITRGADDAPLAIHRTYLAHDGSGKAPVDPQRMMLGPCHGGAVRLAAPGDVLMVAEGIESALSAMQATGNSAWAALSTSGLRTLDLPRDARDVIVLADGDEPGEAAAQDCARRWKREGRRVRIARPPKGLDFNDLLVGRIPREERAG
jgi:putative DNA primase/helicase